MAVLYYALGGGLGHLTRARAVLHTLWPGEFVKGPSSIARSIAADISSLPNSTTGLRKLPPPDDLYVLASPVRGADSIFTADQLMIAPEAAAGAAGFRIWLRECLKQVRPDVIFIDAFPAGIFGEFSGVAEVRLIPLIHIARLLRWREYSRAVEGFSLRFKTTYLVEDLEVGHQEFLRRHSDGLESLRLTDPPEPPAPALEEAAHRLSAAPRPWLIVHSGSDDEIGELIAYAMEMQAVEQVTASVFLLSPRRPSRLPREIAYLDFYPACALFPYGDRIITGCGFNVMRQAEPFREKHRFVPFARRWDDQFSRAARRRLSS